VRAKAPPFSALRWRRAYYFFVIVVPLLAFTAYLVAVLKTDSVHPGSDLHCDSTSPLWFVGCRLPGCVSRLIFFCQASSPGLRRCPNSFIHALLHPFYCDRHPHPSDARQIRTRTSHRRRRPNSNSINSCRQRRFSLDNVWTVSCHPRQWCIRQTSASDP
jgi:hypothetical protein